MIHDTIKFRHKVTGCRNECKNLIGLANRLKITGFWFWLATSHGARGTTLNEALDRPEVSVPIQEMGYPNEEIRQSHEEPQQLLSPNEQVACTYAEYQTTATSTLRASERYPRLRQASPRDSDVGYPIQETSGQPQKQSMQPQNPVEHACTCPTCQPSPSFQLIY